MGLWIFEYLIVQIELPESGDHLCPLDEEVELLPHGVTDVCDGGELRLRRQLERLRGSVLLLKALVHTSLVLDRLLLSL